MGVRGIFKDFPTIVLLIFWLRFSISLPLVFVAMFFIETAFDVEPTWSRIDDNSGSLALWSPYENVTNVLGIFVKGKIDPGCLILLFLVM